MRFSLIAVFIALATPFRALQATCKLMFLKTSSFVTYVLLMFWFPLVTIYCLHNLRRKLLGCCLDGECINIWHPIAQTSLAFQVFAIKIYRKLTLVSPVKMLCRRSTHHFYRLRFRTSTVQ